MKITHSDKPCGIVHTHFGNDVYLPLERVEVHADVVDVSALVTTSQQFWQPSPHGLLQAKYVFPVPSRAAVCGFEMIAEDGKIITAVVKEREEARREHQAAISQGFMTGLVEHVTDDVFSISLGALPGQQVISTKITYVLDLMEDGTTDQVRLQLPMYIGKRFGVVPEGTISARMVPPDRITISVDVRMQGSVKKIVSPTHPTVLTSRYESTDYAAQTARYTSPDFMLRDFVLIIAAEGLDAPRCFAQRASNGTVAMQLSVVPKFSLSPIPQQEYIFLVDQSGSMDGPRIETAKRALMLLLRSLPVRGTRFNIFSFGTHCDSLWPSSVEYGERSVTQATQHIDAMSATYGGTEIRNALEHALQSRKTDTPSSVFVLTDGEAWDIDHTIQPIKLAVQNATKSAPLRVFTLGIGETISSALCEDMARTGNGICLMATTAETIIGKCTRLVRASRTYILKNVFVDWGVLTNLTTSSSPDTAGSSTLRQAPTRISAIYPGNRFVVFALVENQAFVPPKEVVIHAQRDGEGDIIHFTVPVQRIEFPPDSQPQPLVQTLAARRAIMDLEDRERGAVSPDTKSLIIRLGTQYQLASRFTSFIAVDKRTRTEVQGPRYETDTSRPDPSSGGLFGGGGLFGRAASNTSTFGGSGSISMFGAAPRSSALPASGGFGAFSAVAPPAAPFTQGALYGAPGRPVPSPTSGRLFGASPSSVISAASGGFFCSSSQTGAPLASGSLFGAASPCGSTPAAQPAVFLPTGKVAGWNDSPSSQFQARKVGDVQIENPMDITDDDPMDTTDDIPPLPANVGKSPQLLSTEDETIQLIRLQSFDGSFPPDGRLQAILGSSISYGEAKTLGVSEKIWATALAIAFLKMHMKDQPELLLDLVEKARALILRTPGVDADKLLARAEVVVATP